MSACGRRGCPLRPYTRSGGALNCAPSLTLSRGAPWSLACRGLRGHPHLPTEFCNCARLRRVMRIDSRRSREWTLTAVSALPRPLECAVVRARRSVDAEFNRVAKPVTSECAASRSHLEGSRRGPRRAAANERVKETRDRAERGSAVRGSDQASVRPEEEPPPTYRR
jgi:hypothetical protein